jgi:hypothetical protein
MEQERFTFINVKREAGVACGLALFGFLAVSLALLPARPLRGSTAGGAVPQEVKPPKYDYMSGFLLRSTQPLGLKENPALKKMLNQGAVRWAIRAGFRHVLD